MVGPHRRLLAALVFLDAGERQRIEVPHARSVVAIPGHFHGIGRRGNQKAAIGSIPSTVRCPRVGTGTYRGQTRRHRIGLTGASRRGTVLAMPRS